MSSKFTVTPPGVDIMKREITKSLSFLKTKKFTTVGIHEDSGNHPKTSMTNATLGATLNFGTDDGRIPPRPWLSPGVESGKKEYEKEINLGIKKKKPLDLVLERVGLLAAGKVKEYMTNLDSPKNAKSTIKAKGFDNPLIHSGELRASVTSQLSSTKPSEGL